MTIIRSTLFIAASAFIGLGGCAAVPPSGPDMPGDVAYMAVGTDGPWVLEITASALNFIAGPEGQIQRVANPGARPSFNGTRYPATAMVVDVTATPCADSITRRRYADTVTVATGGKTFHGCGGALIPAADLSGTRWTLVSIAGTDAAPDVATEIRFDGKRMAGSVGCNQLNTDYTSDGTRFTAGPVMATRMFCDGPGMAQESAFIALLGAPLSLRILTDGKLVLMGSGGVSAVLRPKT